MKKHILSFLMLFATISIAVAQPAMMTKGQVSDSTHIDTDSACQDNRLSVEIVDLNGGQFSHPQHPENGLMCPTRIVFKTSQSYNWYEWETSLPSSTAWNYYRFTVDINYSGYIKVTVGDNYGHTGTDSIWFNVRNANVPPMENFIMEIDDNLHAKFSGITTEVHHKLLLTQGYVPGQFIHYEYFFLSPGEWSFTDTTVSYSDDSLWIYCISLYDLCESCFEFLVPGLLLSTTEDQYQQVFLTMKTIIQKTNGNYYVNKHFVYFIYTIDEFGNRHHYIDYDGNPVVISNPRDTCWLIPAPHIDPYYQVGVGRQLEDGSYQLLSLSNKVPNPWPDIDGIDEPEKEKPFSIFPNPSNGMFTVEGKGQMRVCNLFGQIILTKEIDGQMTLELPPGMYFVNIDGTTRKVVVE